MKKLIPFWKKDHQTIKSSGESDLEPSNDAAESP